MAAPPKPPPINPKTGKPSPESQAAYAKSLKAHKAAQVLEDALATKGRHRLAEEADAQAAALASQKEYLKISEDISKVEVERLQAQGEFVTAREKELIALREQNKLEDIALELARNHSRIQDGSTDATERRLDAQDRALKQMSDMNIDLETANKIIEKNTKLTKEEVAERQKLLDSSKEHERTLDKVGEKIKSMKDSSESMVGKFAELGMGFKNYKIDLGGMNKEGINFSEAITSMAQGFFKVFNVTNLVANILTGMFEQTMELIGLQSQFTKATGMSAKYAVEGFEGARESANSFAGALIATREESMQAVQALTEGLPAFTRLTQEGRNELAGMTTALQQVGVDGGDAAVIINEMMSVMNLGALEVGPRLYEMTEEMKKFGITPKEFTKNLAIMLPRFAEFGKKGQKIFMNLSKTAKALNVEMDSIINLAGEFDTFEKAAPKVATLNAMMSSLTGTNAGLFNSFELVMAVDPEEKFAIISEKVEAAGLSIAQMAESDLPKHKFALRALSETLGVTTSEFIKMFNEHKKGSLEMVSSEEKLSDAITAAQTPSEVLQAVLQDLLPDIKAIALGFRDFIGKIQEFGQQGKETISKITGVLGGFTKVAAVAFLAKFWAGATLTIKGFTTGLVSMGAAAKAAMIPLIKIHAVISVLQGLYTLLFEGASLQKAADTTWRAFSMGLGPQLIEDPPGMANGGVVGSRGTMALVGERGPEIVGLPPRSAVLSNKNSKKLAGGNIRALASGTTSLEGVGTSEDKIARAIASVLSPVMEKINGSIAKVGDANVYIGKEKMGKFVEHATGEALGKFMGVKP